MASEKYKGLEPYAPSFKDRLRQLSMLSSNVKRVLVRTQPYIRAIKRDVIANLKRYKDSGVHGLIMSTISLTSKRQGMVRHGDMWLYPENQMYDDYTEIRQACHDNKLRFYCADGRLRYLSDSSTCCGCDKMDGFKPNMANLNHSKREYTEKMQELGTGEVFGNIHQRQPAYNRCKNSSYMACMEAEI
jgi:DNA repair photolyase